MPADPRHGVRSLWSHADPNPNATIRSRSAAIPARAMIAGGAVRAMSAIRGAIAAGRAGGRVLRAARRAKIRGPACASPLRCRRRWRR
ncbi:MAG: hypothetical protein Q8N18_22620, partial [Opitutaceae bacterium]|nr:hypothetical protein [Opitutaceae bacterium]